MTLEEIPERSEQTSHLAVGDRVSDSGVSKSKISKRDINFLKEFIYFYWEGKGGRKRGRETSVCGCLLSAPYPGPGPQPRYVPWLGIKAVTLWCSSGTQATEPHQPGLKGKFIYKEQQRDQKEWRRDYTFKKIPLIFSLYPSTSSCTSHKMLNNSGNMGTLALFLTLVELFIAFSIVWLSMILAFGLR